MSEDTKDSDMPGLIVAVYTHLALVSLELLELAKSGIYNLYVADTWFEKNYLEILSPSA